MHPDPDPLQPAEPDDPEESSLDYLVVLGRHKRSIAGWTLGIATLAAVISFLVPRTFTGVTRILTPQQGQSTAALMMGQIGGGSSGLGGLAGSALGIRNPTDLYVGMLKSDTVADALVTRFDLRNQYGVEYLADARLRLAKLTRFLPDKSGIIAIEVDARDPKLAADLANAYVEQLHKLTTTLAISEAAQRRLFFEQQLQQTKDRLADAEVKLRQALESGGVVSVDAQGRAAVETVARLRAQISAKEIQIGAMKGYAAPSNPDLQRAEKELLAMREGLSRLESGGSQAGDGGGDVKGLGNIRLMREVKYHEVLFEQLAKMYEIARADEAKEAPLVQVLDPAALPEKKSGPRRALIVAGAAAIGFVAAVLFAFARTAMENARTDPFYSGRLDALRSAWSWRKPGRDA